MQRHAAHPGRVRVRAPRTGGVVAHAVTTLTLSRNSDTDPPLDRTRTTHGPAAKGDSHAPTSRASTSLAFARTELGTLTPLCSTHSRPFVTRAP